MKNYLINELRDIKNNKLNFFILAFLVFITIFLYVSITTSINRLEENYENYLTEQNVEDFSIHVSEVNFEDLTAQQQLTICLQPDFMLPCMKYDRDNPTSVNSINALLNQKITEYPDMYDELIDSIILDFTENYDLEIEKTYSSILFSEEFTFLFRTYSNNINIPYIVEGQLPNKLNEIAVFPEFLKMNNLTINDEYVIDNTSYIITGTVYLPHFISPMLHYNNTSNNPSTDTIVLCTEETIQNNFILPTYIYQGTGDLSFLFEEYTSSNFTTFDISELGKNFQIIDKISLKNANFRIIMLDLEVENARIFIDYFIIGFMLFSLILLTIFMSRKIDKSKDNIYILKSLGFRNHEIIIPMLSFPFLIMLFTIIGYLLGILSSNLLFHTYSSRYYYPTAAYSFDIKIFFLTTIVPIGISMIILYIFINFKVNKKPLDILKEKYNHYLKTPFYKAKSFHKIWLHTKFISITNTFVYFIVFFIVSVMCIFSLHGNQIFNDFADYTTLGKNYDEIIVFNSFRNTELNDDSEGLTRVSINISKINDEEQTNQYTTVLYGINPNTDFIYLINDDKTKNALLNEGAIISEQAAEFFNLEVNDEITVLVGYYEYTVTILGISNELIDTAIYINITDLNNLYNLDETYYNSIFTKNTDFNDDYILSRVQYNAMIDEFTGVLKITTNLLYILVIVSSIICLSITILTSKTILNENLKAITILKSLGYKSNKLNIIFFIPYIFIIIFSWCIAVPVTKHIINVFLSLIIENLGFKLIFNFSLVKSIIALIIIIIIYIFTIVINNIQISKISPTDILKRESEIT